MEKIKLGGLWINETRDGKKYMSGSFTYGTKLCIFKNDYKEKESDPDYVMHLVPANKEKPDDTVNPEDTPF